MPLSKLEEIVDDFLIPTVEPEVHEGRFTSSDSEDTQAVESSSATRANSLETSPQLLYIDETPSIKKEQRYDEAKLSNSASVAAVQAEGPETFDSEISSGSTPRVDLDLENQQLKVAERSAGEGPIPAIVPDANVVDLDDDGIQIMEWGTEREEGVYSKIVGAINPKLPATLKKGYKQEEIPLRTIDRFTAAIPELVVEAEGDLDLNFTVVRDFISQTFGGAGQGFRPKVGEEKRRQMREDGFGEGSLTFMNIKYNPYLPQLSGRAGISFSNLSVEQLRWDQEDAEKLKNEEVEGLKEKARVPQKQEDPEDQKEDADGNGDKNDGIERLFICLAPRVWLYVGQYESEYMGTLSKEEWDVELTDRVKSTWVDGAMKLGWGVGTRVRTLLRNRHNSNRTFTRAEYYHELGKLESKDDIKALTQKLTREQIRECFDRGEELITVIVMECVGYDYAFQDKMQREFPPWDEKQRKIRALKSQQKAQKKTGNKRALKDTDGGEKGHPSPKKRKTNKGSKAASDSDKSSESENKDYEGPQADSDLEEVDDPRPYTSRGTRSRPRAVRSTRN
ncbi:hypothetical protein V5O48_011539 [Marasmius crinis-equi]|uniref:DUF6697 domain-containing protein n=1 Tax=Marasmius crinis-equi TaxID=585013 RepID=A0ABR3F5A1_9AGAR